MTNNKVFLIQIYMSDFLSKNNKYEYHLNFIIIAVKKDTNIKFEDKNMKNIFRPKNRRSR